MKRTITLLVLVGLLCPMFTWAQQKTITGSRAEISNGPPDPAATIQIISIERDTGTDAGGHFSHQASLCDMQIVSNPSYPF
ncbi:MAG: hypothetical protein ACRDE2_02380 [Chitinophagaceae bacterium]